MILETSDLKSLVLFCQYVPGAERQFRSLSIIPASYAVFLYCFPAFLCGTHIICKKICIYEIFFVILQAILMVRAKFAHTKESHFLTY